MHVRRDGFYAVPMLIGSLLVRTCFSDVMPLSCLQGYSNGGSRPVLLSYRVGKGSVVLNGLDLDLSSCSSPTPPRPSGGCPKAFPYPMTNGLKPGQLSNICYNDPTDARNGEGPCGSWCALRITPGCATPGTDCVCGCGCAGSGTNKTRCPPPPPSPPAPPPPSPPLPPPTPPVAPLDRHLPLDLHLLAVLANATLMQPSDADPPWRLAKLPEYVESMGARCLDGSPASMFVQSGDGLLSDSFIIDFEGGGWCYGSDADPTNPLPDCAARAGSVFGSSAGLSETMPYPGGFLSSSAADNPDFHNWTKVCRS